MDSANILLANFDKLVEKSLYEMLCRSGHKVDVSGSHEETLAFLEEKTFQIVLTDLSGKNQFELLEAIREKNFDCEIIILSSCGNLETAVSAIKMGAFDYLARPIKDEKILSSIERALMNRQTRHAPKIRASRKNKSSLLKQFARKNEVFYGLVGTGDEAKDINSLIERIADAKTTILIQGESGTGKRLIAQAIHKADKKRRHKPFVELSCGALPRDIIESELFGHTKGAFTGAIADRKGRFELAHSGTILLDDIDSLPLDLQVKLLRILQQREFERVGDHKTMKVDVRVIATTNQDIKKAVHEKRFREDLYYRINVISMEVPPLRKRTEDLPLLVEYFIDFYSKENHKKIKGISEETIEVLLNYNWPGNIRELENIIERAIILDTDGTINTDDLPEIILSEKPVLGIIKSFATSLKEALQEPEKVHIIQVLKEVGWNKKKAAKKLGVNRTTLYNKLRKYNIFSHTEEQ